MLLFSLCVSALILALFLLSLRKVGAINAVMLFVASYFVFVVPKYFVMNAQYEGNTYYFRNILLADRYLVNLSFVLVSAFVAAVLVSFLLFLPAARATERPLGGSVWMRTRVAYLFIFPLGLLITYVLFRRMDIDLLAGFSQKRSFLTDSGSLDLTNYLLIKVAYIVKIPFYIYLYQYPTLKNRRGWVRATAALSFAFGALLHVVFSQRSGVFLMALDLLFVVSAFKPVRIRRLVAVLAALFLVNVGVLVSRGVGSDFLYLLVVMFLRRYFMDVEKISNILGYMRAQHPVGTSSGMLVDAFRWDFSHFTLPEDIHFFIGGEVFGLGLGVPPSLVGEVILRMGTAALIPVAILVGYGLKRLDLVRFRSASNLAVVVSSMTIVRATYFFSNSDVVGFILRLALDLGLLAVGMGLYWATKQTRRVPEPAS